MRKRVAGERWPKIAGQEGGKKVATAERESWNALARNQ